MLTKKGNRGEWSQFNERFQRLAETAAKPLRLSVSEDLSGETNLRRWVLAPSLASVGFSELAEQSGKFLCGPKSGEPMDFWLECLSIYLYKHADSRGLRLIDTCSKGMTYRLRLIEDAIRASIDCCEWLSKSVRNAVTLVAEFQSAPLPWHASLGKLSAETAPESGGAAWAANKNRQREARTRIVEALRELGIPQGEWPTFVRHWQAKAATEPTFGFKQIPRSFQPPAYDRLGPETFDEWIARADKAWGKHRDEVIVHWRNWEDAEVDEKVRPPTRPRGPGTRGKERINVDVSERYRWAALRLMGNAWKQIDAGTSAVEKAASRVLRLADWPTEMTAIRYAIEAAWLRRTPHSTRAVAKRAGVRNPKKRT